MAERAKFGPSGDESHSVLFSRQIPSVIVGRMEACQLSWFECKKRKKSDWAGLTLMACYSCTLVLL